MIRGILSLPRPAFLRRILTPLESSVALTTADVQHSCVLQSIHCLSIIFASSIVIAYKFCKLTYTAKTLKPAWLWDCLQTYAFSESVSAIYIIISVLIPNPLFPIYIY